MHLRPHAVSAGSVACRVVDSPVGTLDARSCHALDSHGSPHNAAVPGLEVSRGDVLQHQLIQAQLCYQPLQLRVLLLQILQPPGLVHPQTAILFTPPEVGLLHDSRFLTRLWRRLSVRHGYFDLPQKGHYLFRTMLLASRHLPLLLFQFVSTPLAQIEPATPRSAAISSGPLLTPLRRSYMSKSRYLALCAPFVLPSSLAPQRLGEHRAPQLPVVITPQHTALLRCNNRRQNRKKP